MFINNKDITIFDGHVQNKMNEHGTIKKNVSWGANALLPVDDDEVKELKPLSIRILFKGKTRDIVHKNISNFMKEVSKCIIKFKNLSNYFQCYYQSHSIEESGIDEWLFINFTFSCYEYGERKSYMHATKTFKVINEGNKIAPATIELTPAVAMSKLEITGLSDDPIIIKNINANETIILSGEEDKVMVGNVNKFNDVDLWEFPRLLPGENTITLSMSNVVSKVSYKSMFN